jgi:hypothetical protein
MNTIPERVQYDRHSASYGSTCRYCGTKHAERSLSLLAAQEEKCRQKWLAEELRKTAERKAAETADTQPIKPIMVAGRAEL